MFAAIEFGGQWPLSLRPDSGADLIMVVQAESEDPRTFAKRCLAKMASVLRRGTLVVSAVLAVAPVFDMLHLEARCSIAGASLRAFGHGSTGKLYSIEACKLTQDCRAHLLAIAEGLTENGPAGSQVCVVCESCSVAASWTARAIT